MAMTPRGNYFGVLAGIVISAIVSFLIASFFIKRSADRGENMQFDSAQNQIRNLKGRDLHTEKSADLKSGEAKYDADEINKIIFACDAGMGSSAMGASRLRKKLEQAGAGDISVTNKAIEEIPQDAQIVLTHKNLTDRAKKAAPNAEHISIDDFLQTPAYDMLVNRITKEKADESKTEKDSAQAEKKNKDGELGSDVLKKENIKLGLESIERDEAIKMAGKLLYESGYVNEDYIDAMLEREEELTTYIGEGVAIPHGVGAAKKQIKKTGISILQFPEGVDFEGETAYLVIGIAGLGNEHLKVLANLSEMLEDNDNAEKLRTTDDLDYIYKKFTL